MPTIRTKFVAEGEKEYKDALKNIDNGMKVLQSESKKLAAQFEDNADSVEALTAKHKNLDESVLSLKDKLELQEEQLKKVGAAYGEADERTMRMKKTVLDTETALIKAEKELAKIENQLDDNNDALEDATEKTREYDDAQNDAIEGGLTLGDALDGLAKKFGIDLPGGLSSVLGPLGEVNLGFAGLAGIAGKAASKIVDVAKETMDYVDELNTRSSISGIATATLQEFDYMADLVDVSSERLVDTTKDLTNRVGEALSGNEEYNASFEKLGVTLTDAGGKTRDIEEIFWDVIYALSDMESGIERDNIAMKLMGEGARELNPLLDKTSAGLQELRDDAEEAGYVMDEKTLKNVQNLKDGLDKLAATIQGKVKKSFGDIANWLAGDFSVKDMGTGLAYESGNYGHNATGTSYWRGGLTWVGEEGPELVSLPRGSSVYSTRESQAMTAPTFNIYGAQGQDVNAIADAVAHKLYGDVSRKKAAYA